MILTSLSEKVAAAINTVKAEWEQQLQALTPEWRTWAMEVGSSTESNTYLWMRLLGAFREWIGPRVIQNLKGEAFVVKNRPFEKSFGIPLTDIERDQLGMLRPLTDNLAQEAAYEPQNLLEEAQLLAFSQLCYDGQYFFDSDHPHPSGSGTFSNLSTLVLDDNQGYNNVYAIMMLFAAFTGANGHPLNLRPATLVTGPLKLQIADGILKKEFLPGGGSNPLKGALAHRTNPRYVGSYAEYWHIEATPPAGVLRPWLYQNEKPAEITTTWMELASQMFGLSARDLTSFLNNEVYFGADFRGAATFTMPQLAIGSTGTGV